MVTSALLGAFTVQAELGDFDASEHGDGTDYLQDLEFCPEQTPDLLFKIAQIHRTLRYVSRFLCVCVEHAIYREKIRIDRRR